MFAKLLKYEWKSCVRLMTVLAACALGVAVLCGLNIRFIVAYETGKLDDAFAFAMIPSFLFLIFAYYGFIIYASANHYILLYRFYKTRFTDQGYLTFTLPVKTNHIYLSSAVNILIWQAISITVLLACVAIIIFIGLPWKSVAMFLSAIPNAIHLFFTDFPGFIYLIYIPLTSVSSVFISMSAIVVGSVLVKRHKLLASIGIWFHYLCVCQPLYPAVPFL